MSDVILGLRRYLVAKPDIVAKLGSTPAWPVWLFREEQPFPLEGTGKSALVLRRRGAWALPNDHNTLEFPRIEVEIYCDPVRDTGGQPLSSDGLPATRMDAIAQTLSKYLHQVDGDRWWDTIRIVKCQRLDEISPAVVPGSDGLLYGTVQFGAMVG